jgi:integrase
MSRKRRGRGEGSIYYRATDETWVGSISLGHGPDGKRRRRVVYGKTKQEVQADLRRIQGEFDTGLLADVTKLKVGEYLDNWLEHTAKNKVRPTTHLRYDQLVRLHLKPAIGGVPLAKLRAYDVQACYRVMARDGAGARSCQMAGVVLHAALKDAVRLGMVPFNAAQGIAKPKPQKAEMQVYDREQALLFLDAAKEDRLYALYVLALDSGMRQGELFGLEWSDIDFDRGTVQVQRTLEEISGRMRPKETKSARGRRQINLSRFTLDALHEHRKAMLAEGHAGGPIFCDCDGGWLRKAEAAARENREPRPLPRIRFHDLRHTCATLLLLADENVKVISERLGHASIQLTLDTYSHVLPTMQQRAADKMDGIFSRSAPR